MLNLKRHKQQGDVKFIISTVQPICLAWYGKYETGILVQGLEWRIAEGYDTLEEAEKGHEKYCKMTLEEIEKIEWIG